MSPGGLLTIRTESPPRQVSALRRSLTDMSPGTKWQPLAGDGALDPTRGCRAVHEALAGVPRYSDPGEVPFTDGLYFFFESGEDSKHGRPRITRIGNHPRAQHGLVRRLNDHYRTKRDHKNWSVFRRYLGGALLRRDGKRACLEPEPGQGHWESGEGLECDNCAPYEGLVTARLQSRFTFSCVAVENQTLRNQFEKRLIATVAMCRECNPSETWLGSQAYSHLVRSSGLWNSQHLRGPGMTDLDLSEFSRLARASRVGADDLSDTLLLIPCSAGKRGDRDLGLRPTMILDLLGGHAAAVLAEGREQAFGRTKLDASSVFVPAIARYSGQPYATTGVVDGLLDAIARGLHVVILSGGYGVLRAEEPIQDYEAPMQRTLTVWRSLIPVLLRDYVDRNGIRRTFGSFSRRYAAAVPERLSEEDWRAVPSFEEMGRTGSAMRVVPERVAALTLRLLANDFGGADGWIRTG